MVLSVLTRGQQLGVLNVDLSLLPAEGDGLVDGEQTGGHNEVGPEHGVLDHSVSRRGATH